MDWSVEIPRNMNIKSLDEQYKKMNLFLCNNVLRMSIAEFMSCALNFMATFHSILHWKLWRNYANTKPTFVGKKQTVKLKVVHW